MKRKRKEKAHRVRLDKPLMKMGGSLVVTLPNEVIAEWNLAKGDHVTLDVLDGALRIEPKQTAKTVTISQASLEEYSKVMQGIEAKVIMDPEAATLRIELLGADRQSVSTVLNNLWRNLPFLLSMLGLGSVEAPKAHARQRQGREHDKATAGKPSE